MIKYKVDKANGIVIASYEGGRASFKNALEDMGYSMSTKCGLNIYYYDLIQKTMDEVVVCVGKARLHDGDVWDEAKGKKLARMDLHNRFNKTKVRFLKRLKKRMNLNYWLYMLNLERKLLKEVRVCD